MHGQITVRSLVYRGVILLELQTVTLKNTVKEWTPPRLLRALSAWRGKANRYSGDFSSWQDAAAKSGGYDTDAILQRALQAALAVKNGEAAFERDSVLFDE